MDIERAGIMPSVITELDAALAELRYQGLTVRLHSGHNNTWHIADGGLYSGYVASGDELVELKRANKLNIRGIKELLPLALLLFVLFWLPTSATCPVRTSDKNSL